MAERRPLVEGLKPAAPPVDPKREADFVFGEKSRPIPEAKTAPTPTPTAPAAPAATLSRSPISTRIRTDFAAALKRASLERQLNGKQPNTLQDILEEAIEPWLKSNGYLP